MATFSHRLAVALVAAAASPAAAAAAVNVSTGIGTATHAPAVAIGDGQRAVAVWRRTSDTHVIARSVSADGTLGSSVDVSGAAAGNAAPNVVPDGAGGTVVAWVRADDGHVVARRMSAGGQLDPIVDLSGIQVAGTPAVGLAAANGRVAVTWRNSSESRVYVRSWSPGSSPGPTVDVSGGGADTALYGTTAWVTLDDAGNATLVWHRGTDCHILSRRVTVGGSTDGQTVDISGQPDNAIGDTSPIVVPGPSGSVLIGWHRDADDSAVVRRRNADGSLTSIQRVGGNGDTISLGPMGLAPATAGAVVAWQRTSDGAVLIRNVDGSGQPAGSADTLGTAPDNTGANAATSDRGTTAIAWIDRSSRGAMVHIVGGTASPPPASPAPSPSPGVGSPQRSQDGGAPRSNAPASGSGTPSVTSPGASGSAPGHPSVKVTCRTAAPCTGRVEIRLGRRVLASRAYRVAGQGSSTIPVRVPAKSVGKGRVRATAVVMDDHGAVVGRSVVWLGGRRS